MNPRRISNFHDLGGLRAADGRVIAPRKLYRSGHLARLRPRGQRKLRSLLNVRIVADLRSASEVMEKPDVVVSGVSYHLLPPLTNEQNPSISRHNRRQVLNRLMARQDGTRGYLRETYRTLVSSPMALDAYHDLLQLLLDEPEGGVLWHCTQGKDRAGMGTAIVLMALGASRETIVHNYMRSNRSCRLKNWLIFAGVFLCTLNLHMARSLYWLLTARTEYINAAFDELDQDYGGTAGFLHEALGFSDLDLTRLRKAYLI